MAVSGTSIYGWIQDRVSRCYYMMIMSVIMSHSGLFYFFRRVPSMALRGSLVT